VLSDILEAADNGDVAALVLLDLSAAFDTVDHAILCRRLQVSYGLCIVRPVLELFRSYLHGRSQYVRRGTLRSPRTWLTCGVPQGSVLGPILFIIYTVDIVSLVGQHGFPHTCTLMIHKYMARADHLLSPTSRCACLRVSCIAAWMLQLNTGKTDLLWCATSRRRHQLPTSSFRIGSDLVKPSATVRDLGIYFDADLSMFRKQLPTALPSYASCAV